ncbi:MAG TPA: AI-2E family transporter [Burkholderiales bacterium]|nr:AI-2E family transporter [Burkholderiales bacterium]
MDQINKNDAVLGLAVLGLLIAGCLLVLRPFLTGLLWAIVLTFSTWPMYTRLKSRLAGRAAPAALLMTVAVALVALAPFVVATAALVDNIDALWNAARRLAEQGLPDPPAWLSGLPFVGHSADAYWRGLAHNSGRLLEEFKRLAPTLRTALVAGGEALGVGLTQIAVSVLFGYFLYRDGEAVAARVQAAMSRLIGPRARRLLDIAANTTVSVVYGILGTALAQGLLAGVGFLIAGVPGAPLLGLAVFFLSIVPVGPPLIWIPASLWLLWQGSTGWAIFLALWGLIVVSGADNVLKPMLISRGSHMPFIMVFVGVLGGALAFGFIGVFLGPTLLAVGYRLLLEWTPDVESPDSGDA